MGRHARKKNRKATLVRAAGVTGAGLGMPMVLPSSASADSMDAADVTAVAQEGCPDLDSAELDLAVQIAYAESGFDSGINAFGGEDSRGLWQINAGVHGSPWGDLYDPVTNAEAMCDLSSGGSDWSPWSAYTNGSYLGSPGATSGGVVPGGTPEPEPDAGGTLDITSGNQATYTVGSGDTLYDIAKQYLGDGHTWGQIYNHGDNREAIGDNPDVILAGQELSVPDSSQTSSSKPEPEPAPAPATDTFVSPVDAPVSQVYGNAGGNYTLGYHTGTDFSAASGTNTVAVTGGTVVASDTSSSYGTNVQIQLEDGNYALYAHLSGASVSEGDQVEAGDLVGYVGNTGTSTGPHLHFEIRTEPVFAEGNFLDPVEYLRDNGVTI
jgi:LysM repeat protein